MPETLADTGQHEDACAEAAAAESAPPTPEQQPPPAEQQASAAEQAGDPTTTANSAREIAGETMRQLAADLSRRRAQESASPPQQESFFDLPARARLQQLDEFGIASPSSARFVSKTANDDNYTIDCVWYGGAMVPRIDRDTGEPYMLKMDMAGCRMERLNAGAPVFDTHFTGDDYKSLVAGKVGTKAQLGVVQKAWADGDKGLATVQFDGGTEDGREAYRKAKSGITQNLSFGTWIYKREKTEATSPTGDEGSGIDMFTATDWEPFELGPCTVPADFSTQFLTAESGQRAASPTNKQGGNHMPETNNTGTAARPTEEQLSVVKAETLALERSRVRGIEELGATHNLPKLASKLINDGTDLEGARAAFTRAADVARRGELHKATLGEEFIQSHIDKGSTPEQFALAAIDELAKKSDRTVDGGNHRTHSEHTGVTRDRRDSFLQQVEAALVWRQNPEFYSGWASLFKMDGPNSIFFKRNEEKYADLQRAQKEMQSMASEFSGCSLVELGRMCLEQAGVSVRRMSASEIATRALGIGGNPTQWVMMGSGPGDRQFFTPGAQSASDFPAILANVANKFLRQAYEAYPRTFQPFCRQTTAKDFKPVNMVQMSDSPALEQLNELGEFTTATVKDSNQSFSLKTFGRVIRITRKAIINDDLGAFLRLSSIVGVAAARMESDVVWGNITGNQTMGEDGKACFHTDHNNLFSGSGSALGIPGLQAGRTAMRQQKGPQGTYLNLVPSYILLPTALETPYDQLATPGSVADPYAPTSIANRIPSWVPTLRPIIEPRLDAVSTTAWWLVSDPAVIDTAVYTFLEGQAGLYLETRQGFEADAIELKAREDFGTAVIDYRSFQQNAGQ